MQLQKKHAEGQLHRRMTSNQYRSGHSDSPDLAYMETPWDTHEKQTAEDHR